MKREIEIKEAILKIQEEINLLSEDLVSGQILTQANERLVKEYTLTIGKIDGLKLAKSYIESEDEDE